MQKLYKILIFLIPLFGATQITAATATDIDELIQLLNNFQTMKATFVQSLVNGEGSQLSKKTTGTMMLERPGKFRWEIKEPNSQIIILNQNKSLLYDADLAQVVKRKLNYQRPGNPAMLLSSTTTGLTQSFKVVKLKTTDKGTWFELMPKPQKNQETDFQWIKIQFINGQLNSMSIADNFGQKSIINFDNVEFNPKIPPQMFVFTPPPNTEVFNAD